MASFRWCACVVHTADKLARVALWGRVLVDWWYIQHIILLTHRWHTAQIPLFVQHQVSKWCVFIKHAAFV